MKRALRFVVMALVLGVAVPAAAGPTEDVAAATQAWADGFNGRNLEGLLGLYDRDAVFWGTSSQTLRDTPDLIRDYFKGLPTSQITVKLGESRVRVLGDVAINTGYYTFTNVRNGQPVPNAARFSFTYRQRNGRWLIMDHHSSAVPAAPRQ